MLLKKEKAVMTGIRIYPSVKAKLQKEAKKRGTTFTQLVLSGAYLISLLDDDLLQKLDTVAQHAQKQLLTEICDR